MNAEAGGPGKQRLDCHERRPARRRILAPQDSGKLFDRRSFEERSQRQLHAKNLFDLREKLNGERRVSTQVQVILVRSNGAETQNFLPNRGKLLRRVITRGGWLLSGIDSALIERLPLVWYRLTRNLIWGGRNLGSCGYC